MVSTNSIFFMECPQTIFDKKKLKSSSLESLMVSYQTSYLLTMTIYFNDGFYIIRTTGNDTHEMHVICFETVAECCEFFKGFKSAYKHSQNLAFVIQDSISDKDLLSCTFIPEAQMKVERRIREIKNNAKEDAQEDVERVD